MPACLEQLYKDLGCRARLYNPNPSPSLSPHPNQVYKDLGCRVARIAAGATDQL